MSLALGIIGLPNVGKSTLFSALTNMQVDVSQYPFTTIEPNKGVVPVPDERLDKLARLLKPEKKIYPAVKFIDIAGLVKGAHAGEGLGNQFLHHIREVDALVHVVRFFEKEEVAHVSGRIDPKADIELINLELVLADLERLEKIKNRLQNETKALGKKDLGKEKIYLLEELQEFLKEGQMVRDFIKQKGPDSGQRLAEFCFLTAKPVFYVANIGEENLPNIESFDFAVDEEVIPLSADLEYELSRLASIEKKDFLTMYDLEQTGLEQVIKKGYKILKLITFFTIESNEVRGWSVAQETKAPQAAGKIHSDFEEGFIKAEVVSCAEFIEEGSWQKLKEKGKVRLEGKDYQIKDGDVVLFKFAS